ncbi:MAG: hypothetical protein AAF621_00500 [Pseudomonadota bacterium]
MALDIRGSLKNTKLNRSQYIVFDELLSNSIDSYLIRQSTSNDDIEPLKVEFKISIIRNIDLLGETTSNDYGEFSYKDR